VIAQRLAVASAYLMAILAASSGITLSGEDADGAGGVQNRGAGPAQATPRSSAPIDITGYWVSIVSEDWRFRMITPRKGDYQGVPMTPEARKLADAWDPAADAAAGNQCRPYGAAAIMRVPGRFHITWQDDATLRVEADAGTQTRLFRFAQEQASGLGSQASGLGAQASGLGGQASGLGGQASAEARGLIPEPSTWQGQSLAQWERPAAPRGGGPPPAGGALRVVTTRLLPGYLRRNGVPYSENAVVTEYFDLGALPDVGQVLLVTTVVDDPRYLQQPFIVSTHFKKEPDGSKWDPTPCATTW
jgi:hypothetical protein